jgi:lycopene cyclase domain-containing protein
MSLYGWVIILSFAGPLALSFDKKVHFFTYWKPLFISVFAVGVPFLIWDEFFTTISVWGFNPTYLWGIYIGHLPLEEVLFFLVVPYNCLFIHEVLKAYFPKVNLTNISKLFALIVIISSLIFSVFYFNKYYTLAACALSMIYTFLAIQRKCSWFSSFVFTYLVCLIPFLIVNGILTGGFTPLPIVWYSEKHIIGVRIDTIPIEDLFYNYSLLFPIVALFETLKNRRN